MNGVKTLHLLRHAKSNWDDPDLPDSERPLAPRGRRAAAAIARQMRASSISPELLICSPAVRAGQTLERLGDAVAGGGRVLESIRSESLESAGFPQCASGARSPLAPNEPCSGRWRRASSSPQHHRLQTIGCVQFLGLAGPGATFVSGSRRAPSRLRRLGK